MDFKVVEEPKTGLRTVICTIASATVVEAGDMIGVTSGLIVKAGAATAKLAFSPFACANGDTQIEATVGNDFVLEGTGDAVFAVAQKGTEVDIAMSGDDQQIDVGTSTTDVFVIDISENAGTVGSASGIRVKINDGYQLF